MCVLAVCAKSGKQSGATCFALPRAQFLPLLKLFPAEEEILVEAALNSYDDDSMSASNHRYIVVDAGLIHPRLGN
jgi:hypothetical protein